MTTHLIQTSPNRKVFVRVRNFSVAFLLLVAPLFRARMNYSSFASDLLGENATIIGLLLIPSSAIIAIASHFISRRDKRLGKLTLTAETISVQLKNKTLNLNIKDITNFKIKRSFTDVKKESITAITSYDNWLCFDYNQLNYEYQFTIESSFANKQLEDLLTIWRNDIPAFATQEVI